jgi:hypothetical protein
MKKPQQISQFVGMGSGEKKQPFTESNVHAPSLTFVSLRFFAVSDCSTASCEILDFRTRQDDC